MKILFLIERLSGGGRERRLVQLIKGLSELSESYETYVLTFSAGIDYEDVFATKARLIIWDSCSRMSLFRFLSKAMHDIKPDIVHSWMGGTTDMILIPFLKWAYHFKYIAGFIANSNRTKSFSLYNFAAQFTYFLADAIVSNSQAGLAAKHAPKKKSLVIYNGFDFARLTKRLDISKKRKQLNITTPYVVTMVARVSPAKDYESFVALAEKAKKDKMPVLFLAIGKGESLDYFKKRAIDNIVFLGQRNDVEEILQASDISVLFTNDHVHSEGVSNSIMEAMAVGLPVIATAGGGTAEIIDNEVDGFIITPKDVNSCFALLKRLLKDDSYRATVGRNAVDKVKEKFLLSKMVDEYIKLYKAVL